MKKILHTYTLILTIGFFLMPNLNFACETKIEKECCCKEISSRNKMKDCCKNSHSNHKDKSCEGKCGNSKCTPSSINYSFAYLRQTEFRNIMFEYSNKKQLFFNLKTFISSGYSSLWLIPKIS